MNNQKFLGICIIIAAFMVSVAIIWHAKAPRYQSVYVGGSNGGQVFTVDTATGVGVAGFIQAKTEK